MIAVGSSAIEREQGLKDWSACSEGDNCFKVANPSLAMVGTNAGVFDGSIGVRQGDNVGLGSGCWIFLFDDSAGWHYINSGCFQNGGFVPGPGDHVNVTGCANFRSAPALSGKVIGCLGNGTVVDVDSAPVYADGHIWWHLADRGWMAHDYMVG